MKHSPTAPPAAPAAVDLKHHLLLRVSLFALAIGVLATVVVLHQTRERIRGHISRSGVTVERLIAGEADQLRDAFRRSLDGLSLSSLDGIGPLLGICVAVEDLYKRPVVNRCFHEDGAAPAPVRWALGRLIGPDLAYRGVIGQYPGVKVGEFVVTPDLDSEGHAAWVQIRTVLGMSLAILLLNLLIYRPVRRALRPADQILAVLGRMEAGDLSARMPRPRRAGQSRSRQRPLSLTRTGPRSWRKRASQANGESRSRRASPATWASRIPRRTWFFGCELPRRGATGSAPTRRQTPMAPS